METLSKQFMLLNKKNSQTGKQLLQAVRNSHKTRIQKALAQAGYGSRREIESWITAGRIHINGRLAKLGDQVSPHDAVTIDHRSCHLSDHTITTRVLAYHKPVGEVCTRSDPQGRKTVFSALPPIREGRWITVGRLDANTSGLLLFTNQGELANRLMHPSAGIDREYVVRVLGKVTPEMTKRLVRGVMLEDGKARFEDILDVGGEGMNHWFRVVVVSGRNRMVRRLWESQGVKVSRLSRIRFGSIFLLKSLRRGAWVELDEAQVKSLFSTQR